jgi:hypothetical protein
VDAFKKLRVPDYAFFSGKIVRVDNIESLANSGLEFETLPLKSERPLGEATITEKPDRLVFVEPVTVKAKAAAPGPRAPGP